MMASPWSPPIDNFHPARQDSAGSRRRCRTRWCADTSFRIRLDYRCAFQPDLLAGTEIDVERELLARADALLGPAQPGDGGQQLGGVDAALGARLRVLHDAVQRQQRLLDGELGLEP